MSSPPPLEVELPRGKVMRNGLGRMSNGYTSPTGTNGFVSPPNEYSSLTANSYGNGNASYPTIASPTPSQGGPSHNLSQVQVMLLGIVVASAYVVWGILISLQPPFYPIEAEAKGAKPQQYGFVFGIFNLAAFLGGPIFGKFGGRIGPRMLYTVGAFLQGISGLLFGFLAFVEDTSTFIILSYFLRAIAGFADAAGWGAVLTILLKLFPTKVAVIMSYTEGFFGVGFMIGPALGALLYNWGGFILPFAVVGSIGILVACSMIFVLPHVEPDEETNNQRKLDFKAVLTSPTIFMPFLDNACCFFGNGFLEAMLQPHIHAAGGSVTDGGIAFFMQGLVFMIGMIVCGWLCDKLPCPTLMSVAGNFCLALAFTLIGPLPWISSIKPSVSLMKGAMAFVGMGYACIMVSTYSRAQGAAARMGFPKDIDTYLMISGMWTSSLYLGCFAGPTLAGFMVERFNFRTTTILFWACYVVILVADCLEVDYLFKNVDDEDDDDIYDDDEEEEVQVMPTAGIHHQHHTSARHNHHHRHNGEYEQLL